MFLLFQFRRLRLLLPPLPTASSELHDLHREEREAAAQRAPAKVLLGRTQETGPGLVTPSP